MQLFLLFSMAALGSHFVASWHLPSSSRHTFSLSRGRLDWRLSSIPAGRVEDIDDWVRLSSNSLEKLTGINLFDRMDGVDTPSQVHESERYAVLSHGTQDDPIYCYFNAGALLTFQWPEEEVYQLPSRYSAPDGAIRKDRGERMKKIVEETAVQVFPAAIRQTKSGEQFQLTDVILWNVYDDNGERVGQTAIFDRNKIVPVQGSDS